MRGAPQAFSEAIRRMRLRTSREGQGGPADGSDGTGEPRRAGIPPDASVGLSPAGR